MKCPNHAAGEHTPECKTGCWLIRHAVGADKERIASGLEFKCPCGCGDLNYIPMEEGPAPKNKHRWGWNGDEDRPSITPSIRRIGDCKFHGYLTKGLWSACADGPPIDAKANSK